MDGGSCNQILQQTISLPLTQSLPRQRQRLVPPPTVQDEGRWRRNGLREADGPQSVLAIFSSN